MVSPPPPSTHLLHRNIEQATDQLHALRPLAEPLEQAVRLVADCLRSGHKVLTCGNGGSAADAAHLATELMVRFERERRPYPAICLADSGAVLTAMGNDYQFQELFARQVRGHGAAGDVLIGLSTSGRSENLRRALEAARTCGMSSVVLLGRDGGSCRGMATVELLVPGTVTARIQEAHLLLYHTLCHRLDEELS